MRTVYRESVNVKDDFTTCNIAPNANIVHVEAAGHDRVEFWYLTDTHWATTRRTFMISGTGHPAPDDPAASPQCTGAARYIGCAGRNTAGLVWHLWERI